MKTSHWGASLVLALILGAGSPVRADWEFSDEHGWTRSVCTIGDCAGDENHSFVYGGWTAPLPRTTQYDVGLYLVTLYGAFVSDGGNVQVTALGGSAERCKVATWNRSGQNIEIRVACFGTDGYPANSLFNVSYVHRDSAPTQLPNNGIGPESAYVVVADYTNPSYDATLGSPPWAWNSTGKPILVYHEPGTGTYNVTFFGQDGSVQWVLPNQGECTDENAGTVQVTAFGWSNAYCKAAKVPMNRRSGRLISNDTEVAVSCFDGSTGQPTETPFSLSYSYMSPGGARSDGFAYADQPTATVSYNSPKTFSRQELDTGHGSSPHCFPDAGLSSDWPRVTRVGTGLYNVLFPVLEEVNYPESDQFWESHSLPHVTAVGGGSDFCKVNNWAGVPNNQPTTVQVACYTAGGSPTDAAFMVNSSSRNYVDP
jgi:hypothetical protein